MAVKGALVDCFKLFFLSSLLTPGGRRFVCLVGVKMETAIKDAKGFVRIITLWTLVGLCSFSHWCFWFLVVGFLCSYYGRSIPCSDIHDSKLDVFYDIEPVCGLCI
jgi:hypothetical protein